METSTNTNIFTDAKFGDHFKTLDGTLAVYMYPYSGQQDFHCLRLATEPDYLAEYTSDGQYIPKCYPGRNIVSKWYEISDELVNDIANTYANLYWPNPMFVVEHEECKRDFKNGYLVALTDYK